MSEKEPTTVKPTLFPKGTCSSCKKITLHNLLETDSYKKEDLGVDYGRYRHNSCTMCKLVFNSIDPESKLTGEISLRLRVEDPNAGSDMYTGRRIHEVRVSKYENGGKIIKGKLRIYAIPDSYASGFVPYWRAPPSNLSDATFKTIARRIENCDEVHTRCQSLSAQSPESTPRYLPSRVIHVGSDTRQPHLHIVQGQQSNRYVALSHCWGDVPQVRTLRANIGKHQEKIVFGALSKTFQDAIRFTRRLRIEYIWIDSLCIVQDNKDDWLQESEKMGSIYTNAYVTIAATWATNGNGGLESVRPLSNWVRFPCDSTDESKGHVWFTDASWSSQSDLNDAPLNLRGWVLQEKILSRRIIHFASSQVYWECKAGIFGEEREDPIPFPEDATLKPSYFWSTVRTASRIRTTHVENANDIRFTRKSVLSFYPSWRTFIRYYSTRHLTNKTDRLIALMGIIQVIEEQTGLRCFDGHWDDGSSQFLHELMWFPEEQINLSVLEETSQSRLCSSWSWASWGVPVQPSTMDITAWEDHGLKDCSLQLQAIEDKALVPWANHPLKVSGMLRGSQKGSFVKGHKYLNAMYPNKRAFRVISDALEKDHVYVFFDCAGGEPDQFFLSPVHTSKREIACLVLVERICAASTVRRFERVGLGVITIVGMTPKDSGSIPSERWFEGCERETYCII